MLYISVELSATTIGVKSVRIPILLENYLQDTTVVCIALYIVMCMYCKIILVGYSILGSYKIIEFEHKFILLY